ncbi:MAG: AAA family ATPase [Pseudanabaenaceae cyanobacterium bins.39]|nr:AAA family ATPase [Pseudanabaenaceae cyanobacterium bins.39]
MHLQRVQVPDFRVLKDVDITFEKDFNPRVFPLGSQNGGGKSTLLQLIFILLHCSANPERHFAIKNLLSGFTLRKDENQRILAIIDIWHEKEIVQLEFFICKENYIYQSLNYKHEDLEIENINFGIFTELKDIQEEISGFSRQETTLKNIISQIENRQTSSNPYKKFPDHLKTELLSLEIDFESIDIDFSDINFLTKFEKEAKIKLHNNHIKISSYYAHLSKITENLLNFLRSHNIEYITNCDIDDTYSIKNTVLLCKIKTLETSQLNNLLINISRKIFLAAPTTQVFLFLSKSSKKSLFKKNVDYYSDLLGVQNKLTGLFTYNFFATNILISAFAKARDKDFKEALKTGEYGNNYKKLLQDLDFLTQDKQVNITPDFSGITFKRNRFVDEVELEPEDLSHGELKRLNIYIWLKYNDIEDAIVLMDEVDLALHPDWQYQIVSDLLAWEPSNQYILATHSYELCQALTPSHVKVLEPKLTERCSD